MIFIGICDILKIQGAKSKKLTKAKAMKKILSGFILFIVATMMILPSVVLADGMMIKPYPDGWDYSNETNQQAFINYENGKEKMVISVGMENASSSQAVWLFPIPATPDKVAIDVIAQLPRFGGEDISEKAKSNLDDMRVCLLLTQIYPWPFVALFANYFVTTQGFVPAGSNYWSLGADERKESDVAVYEHLEKEGMTTEIITAKTSNGFFGYFKDKGLDIKEGSISVLDHYIGKGYSFVASWISQPSQVATKEYETITKKVFKTNEELISDVPQDAVEMMVNDLEKGLPGIREYFQNNSRDVRGYVVSHPYAYSIVIEYLRKNRPDLTYTEVTEQRLKPEPAKTNSNQKGIFVTFSTDKIYFPLLPTSVYGSKVVPAAIRVIGFVSPKIFKDIDGYAKTGYFVDKFFTSGSGLEKFYGGSDKNVKYTKIQIDAPSKFLTEDLWIDNHVPLKTYYSYFIAQYSVISGFLLLVLCSLIAGLLASLIIFREARNRKGLVKYGFLSLFNIFSILGLMIAAAFSKTKDIGEGRIQELKLEQPRFYRSRKIIFVALILLLPILGFISFFSPFFFMDKIEDILDFQIYNLGFYFALMGIIFVLIVLFIIFVIKKVVAKIDKINQALHNQFSANNYSFWTFQPKDKRKIWFVVVFSILFLIISWGVIELIKLAI